MTKKELEKLIKEYKPKYIYQRYKGELFKYEIVKDNVLLEFKTGVTFALDGNALLGKVSSNIIDLIEEGDYVNGYKVLNVINEEPCPSGKCVDIESNMDSSDCTFWENDIINIVTKEQFEERKFYV